MRASGRRRGCRLAYKTYLTKEDEVRTPRKAASARGRGEACASGRVRAHPSKWIMDVCGDVESLELATTARERLRGMLFRDPDDVTRLLIPCHDIHTFGMRYPLDVAFISRDGCVLEVHRNVATMKRISHKEASLVAERFSRDGDWLKKGDVIHIGSAKRD